MFPVVLVSGRKDEVFCEEGSGARRRLGHAVLLVPGTLLLTAAHRAAATLAFVTVTSQVLRIVQEIVCVKRGRSHPTSMGELRGERALHRTTGFRVL